MEVVIFGFTLDAALRWLLLRFFKNPVYLANHRPDSRDVVET